MKTLLMLSLIAMGLRPAAAQSLDAALTASYAAEAKKDYASAAKALKEVEADNTRDYLLNLRLGWLDYLAGLYGESATYYAKAAALAPGALEPLQGQLLPLIAGGKTADSWNVYLAILKIDPVNYKALSALAWANYNAKEYKNAIQFYTKLVTLYPSDTEMRLGLGYSLKLSGDKDGADKQFREVLRLSPNNSRALAGLK